MRRGVASCGERFGPWCVRRGALLDLDQILTFNLQTMDPPFTLHTHTHTHGRTRHRPPLAPRGRYMWLHIGAVSEVVGS